jgi:linoleate 10R-lipoxygenase
MVMAVMFTAVFFDLDPAKSFPLRQVAQKLGHQLGKLIEANVKAVSMTGFISGLVDNLHKSHSPMTEYGVHMIRRLLESGLGTYEIAWSQILPTSSAMIPNQSQVV